MPVCVDCPLFESVDSWPVWALTWLSVWSLVWPLLWLLSWTFDWPFEPEAVFEFRFEPVAAVDCCPVLWYKYVLDIANSWLKLYHITYMKRNTKILTLIQSKKIGKKFTEYYSVSWGLSHPDLFPLFLQWKCDKSGTWRISNN